jgi:hypothetical protein
LFFLPIILFVIILSIFQVIITALAARRIGSGLGRFAGRWSHSCLRYAFETGLGLAYLSYLIFAAACLHWISSQSLWGLWFALLHLVNVRVSPLGITQLSPQLKSSLISLFSLT